MSVLKLERHPYRYQLMVYFLLPVVGISGLWMFFLAVQDSVNGISGAEVLLALISGIVLLAGSSYFIIRFLKKAPPVSVDFNKQIFSIGKNDFSLDSIRQLDTIYNMETGKFSFFEGSPGIVIHIEEGRPIILEDRYYKNMHELKWYLFQTLKGKTGTPPEVSKVDSTAIDKKEVFWIKNSLFDGKSMFYLLLIIAMLSLTGFQYYTSGAGLLTFGFILMTLISYISFGNQTTYFGFSGKHFLVRNYLSRAHAENWKLSDIKKAVINQRGGVSFLIVEFKDYSYRNYLSILLDSETTELLIKKLGEKRIEIVKDGLN